VRDMVKDLKSEFDRSGIKTAQPTQVGSRCTGDKSILLTSHPPCPSLSMLIWTQSAVLLRGAIWLCLAIHRGLWRAIGKRVPKWAMGRQSDIPAEGAQRLAGRTRVVRAAARSDGSKHRADQKRQGADSCVRASQPKHVSLVRRHTSTRLCGCSFGALCGAGGACDAGNATATASCHKLSTGVLCGNTYATGIHVDGGALASPESRAGHRTNGSGSRASSPNEPGVGTGDAGGLHAGCLGKHCGSTGPGVATALPICMLLLPAAGLRIAGIEH